MDQYRDAVSVAEMARLIHLSRSRLYELLGTTFPHPKRDDQGRPYFDKELQTQIIEARRKNVGLDGKPILFRASSPRSSVPVKKLAVASHIPKDLIIDVVGSVRALGLEHVNKKEVEQCLSRLFPDGQLPEDRGTVVRQVFLSLNRQLSTEDDQK